MKYLFDTDTIIYWLKGDCYIEAEACAVGLEYIAFSIISKAELYFGAYNSIHIAYNINNIGQLSNTLSMLPFDEKSSELFGKIKSDLKKKGNLIADADIMVASIALANGLILVTNNTKHFERTEHLEVENWTKEQKRI